jgi:hypothetical protein
MLTIALAAWYRRRALATTSGGSAAVGPRSNLPGDQILANQDDCPRRELRLRT